MFHWVQLKASHGQFYFSVLSENQIIVCKYMWYVLVVISSSFSPPQLSFSPLGDIPIVPLNFVVISLEGPFKRDTVEGCVKETLLFLSRSISIKQNVEFTFKGIGVLMIRYGKVKMRFYKDFFCAMDGSGALAKALANVNKLMFSFS